MKTITLEMIDNFEIHLGMLIAEVAATAINSLPDYECDIFEFTEDNLDVIKAFSDKYIGDLFEDLGLTIAGALNE